MLLVRTPHLVLDGALLAAEALRAREVIVATAEGEVSQALHGPPRWRSGAPRPSREPPNGTAGGCASSACPSASSPARAARSCEGLNGLEAVPAGRRRRAAEEGVGGLPTLLSNAETFAQLAVLAELGPVGYAEVGTAREPGTVLLTVGGEAVVEVMAGVPLATVLEECGLEPGEGVLVGGYHGAWLGAEAAATAVVSREGMRLAGGVLGRGDRGAPPLDDLPSRRGRQGRRLPRRAVLRAVRPLPSRTSRGGQDAVRADRGLGQRR
ncbi:hypothetical protein GCM10020219_016380 [Nonomuraea dietziae]